MAELWAWKTQDVDILWPWNGGSWQPWRGISFSSTKVGMKEAAFVEGTLQKEEKFTLLYFGSIKNK